MNRREFIAVLGGATIACLHFAHAQQPKVYRVGLLDYSPAEASRMRLWQAFRQQLGELGYVEGQNIAFEPRWADGHADRLPVLAADLVKLKVDVIVTAGTVSAVAAGQATATIPIVMTTGAGARELQLVNSLAKPSGNVTGVTTLNDELSGKRLELVREVVPQGSGLGSLFDPGNQGSVFADQATQTAAQKLGLSIQSFKAASPDEFAGVFSSIARDQVDGLLIQPSSMFFAEGTRLADLAKKNRLVTMLGERHYTEAGGLMSYGTDYAFGFRRAADFVDKILKGAKPGDLPMEQPTKFELVVNLKTAKAIGLTIPESFLLRADEVIE
jgi:putative tryptophan/tyrosine transport system substrate-binding protein